MIELKAITKLFDTTPVLKNLDLTIPESEIFGIIGKSGAGKSTLIRLLNKLELPTTGSVSLPSGSKISMVFQNDALLSSKTVYENVELALKLKGTPKEISKQKVRDVLNYVGMSDRHDAYPSELSGGQKQRVGIARALVTDPTILLCDEVTSALDPETKTIILELLKKINKEKKTTIIIVTHEMSVIKDVCDQVAVIEDGKIIEVDTVEKVCLTPKSKLAKSFMSELLFPENLSLENVDSEQLIYYLLMTQEQYYTFQKLTVSGIVFSVRTLFIKNKRYFSIYYSVSSSEDDTEKMMTLQKERVGNYASVN